LNTRTRCWTVVVLIGVVLALSTLGFADTKPTPELLTNATNDLFPAFRKAAARALVAAELVTGKTLKDLDALLQQQRAEGKFVDELDLAISEAKAGNVVDVCVQTQDSPPPLQGVNLANSTEAELDRFTLTGATADLRRAAAKELLRRMLNRITLGTEYPADSVLHAIENIAQPFDSLYELRVFNKRHEDFVFDELKIDMLDYTIGAKADPRKVELIEEAGFILAKVFYAEFLVTLDKSFVRAHASCDE